MFSQVIGLAVQTVLIKDSLNKIAEGKRNYQTQLHNNAQTYALVAAVGGAAVLCGTGLMVGSRKVHTYVQGRQGWQRTSIEISRIALEKFAKLFICLGLISACGAFVYENFILKELGTDSQSATTTKVTAYIGICLSIGTLFGGVIALADR